MSHMPFVISATTLVGGTKTVADTAIKSTSKIFPTNNAAAGTIGIVSIAITAGVGYVVTSTNILDTSTISLLILY